MILQLFMILIQCSNIFLTKDNKIKLGKKRDSILHSMILQHFLVSNVGYTGDFGLAKLLSKDDLASSVKIFLPITKISSFSSPNLYVDKYMSIRLSELQTTCVRKF